MKLLFVGDSYNGDDDTNLLGALSRLPALLGHKVATSFMKRENATEVAMLCKTKGIDAVICSQKSLLEAALRRLPDYTPPPNNKQITLDDFAGSWIDLPFGIPMIVIQKLERFWTVPHEKSVTNRFISKLTKPSQWFPQTEFKWQQVHEHNQQLALDDIESCDLVAIDIETPGSDDRDITCVAYATYSYSTKKSSTWVVHFDSVWAWRFVQRANKCRAAKIFQNGQYDNAYFARWNCLPTNWLWDPYNLLHCWYSELPKRLDFVAAFALRKQRYWKDDGKGGGLEDLFRYNALDAWATLNGLLALIAEIPQWAAVNYLQEFPMVFPCLNASLESWKIDIDRFREVKKIKEAESAKRLARIRVLITEPDFNPRSPQQMLKLFTVLGCGRLGSTDKAATLKARAASPLNDLILGECDAYKKSAKLESSYLDEKKLWNGRFHYAFDPAGQDTGRIAGKPSAFWCGNSIQVIPRGDTIKSFFVSDDGWLLAEPDKAQSEARCVGYMAGEQKLINLVESSKDYHAWNAQAFFGVPYAAIYDEAAGKTLDEDLRDLSKRTNHGANYNMGASVMLDTMGPKKVAEAKRVLKLPPKMRLVDVCEYLLNAYAATYPNVKGLLYDTIIATIALTNRLVSAFGWTRYFFAKPSKANKPALNAAVAHGPQNLSVAIVNREWYQIWWSSLYGELRNRVRIKAQIHDSIPFQYRVGDLPAVRIVQSMMKTAVTVRGADGVTRTMVIPTDVKAEGARWSTLKKLPRNET